jgi:polyhydroxybutyrate depolymerase
MYDNKSPARRRGKMMVTSVRHAIQGCLVCGCLVLHHIALSQLGAGGCGRQHADSLRVDALQRTFIFYVPDRLSSHPKLIVVLHGSGMAAKEMPLIMGRQLERFADSARNFIVVYPQGYLKYWNDCRKSATYAAKLDHVDDVLFLVKMIHYFTDNYHVDDKAVFAAGYSNGGEMCFKLAKETPGLFKGFATVSANLPVGTNDDCAGTGQPVSIMLINGTSDPVDPYNGGVINLPDGKNRGAVISADSSVQYWKRLAHCDTTTPNIYHYPDINKDDQSTAVAFDYPCSPTGKKIKFVKIINGGHIIPNPGFDHWPRGLGTVNRDINAPLIIYDFFMTCQ